MLRSVLGLIGLVGVAMLAAGAQACSDDAPATTSSSTTSTGGGGPSSSSGDSKNCFPPGICDGTDSGGGSGGNPDSGGEAKATPIEAEANKWTWVPFPDSSCANGSPTGIGVNKGTSKKLVVFLEGGGACWSKATCNLPALVANIPDGFGEDKFKAQVDLFPGGLLDRTIATNPYKDASLVYVPYCTGDVHSGDKVQKYEDMEVKHVGRRNIAAFLKRLVATFKDADKVVLSGSSAGGFGAALNYARFATAFAPTRVDLVDDSGPPFPVESMVHYAAEWSPSWDLPGGFPSDCTGCAADVSKLLPYYLKKYPTARFALLSSDKDQTIRNFFAFPQIMPANEFHDTLASVVNNTFDRSPDGPIKNGRYFILDTTLHTMLRKMNKQDGELGKPVTGEGGVTLATFLTKMDTDAADWASVKPPN